MAYGINRGDMKYRDGNYYHVYNRGSRKGRISSPKKLQLPPSPSCKQLQKYSTAVIAYCLMPNHYHLVLLPTEGGSVSKTLQTHSTLTFKLWIRSTIERLFIQGKTKSIIVDSDEYAVNLVRYIHLNPVKAKLVLTPLEWNFQIIRGGLMIATHRIALSYPMVLTFA